jgi:hypothetical protein
LRSANQSLGRSRLLGQMTLQFSTDDLRASHALTGLWAVCRQSGQNSIFELISE